MDCLEAVLVGAPLDRLAVLTADVTGAPVAIVVPEHRAGYSVSLPSRQERALDAYVRERLRGKLSRRPSAVTMEVTIERGDTPIGAVLLLGDPACAETADEALHMTAGCVLSYLGTTELRARLDDAVGGSLITQLRGGGTMDEQSLRWRAAQAGVDLSQGGLSLCLQPRHGPASHALALIATEYPGSLSEEVDGLIFTLLGLPPDAPEGAWKRMQRLVVRLRTYGHVGVSGHYGSVLELRHAMDEAELMADVGRDTPDASAPDPAPQGTYHLLFRLATSHPEELTVLYESTVGPLVRYDAEHQTDLLKTLTTYLAHDGNMNATASSLFAHRHTVAYRIDRIRDICQLDPARSEHRERLGIGIKAHRIITR